MPESGLVVLDSGPIIGLAAVGQLDVVGELYPTVLIPGAVHREVTIAGAGLPGAQELTRLRQRGYTEWTWNLPSIPSSRPSWASARPK